MSKTPRNAYGDKPGHFPAASQRMRYAPLRPSCAKGSVNSCLLKGQALYERRAREHEPFREPWEQDALARSLDKRAEAIDAPHMVPDGTWRDYKPRVQARLDRDKHRIGLLKLGR